MEPRSLLRAIFAVTIICILMMFTIRYAFKENASWRDLGSKGLHTKIQIGLTQMHWQWQTQGRPINVKYLPENAASSFVIGMSNNGLPILEKSQAGCTQFLYWFVDEKLLKQTIDIAVMYENSNTKGELVNTQELSACRFEYAGHVHIYDINSGQLSFTD